MANNSRARAAKIITAIILDGSSLTAALKQISPADQDRSFIQELCYGVMRWYGQLIAITKVLITKQLKAKDSDIQALILLGLYQVIHLQTPLHAALNETVQAARDLNKSWATKLINGVLRQFLRNKESIFEKINNDPVARYAHPKWLLQTLKKAWPEHWEAIVNANNQRPPMILRVNCQQVARDEYLELLAEQKILAEAAPHADQGIILTTPCNVNDLPGFNEGKVSVQDSAAQLAAGLLDLQPGQRVLDACAAPGGKTAHILETEPKLSELVAIDNDDERLKKISDNLNRLQLRATVKCVDAATPQDWWDGRQFDRILLDAPCSATGVIRRHPDIKVLRRAEDIAALAKTQQQLLTALWSLLKPGGLLLYITCSVLPAENTEVLQRFLTLHTDANEKKIEASWGIPASIGRQIFPGEQQMDGFFYALLEKTNVK